MKKVARLGGGWGDGACAGAFCWHLYGAASDRYRYVGGQLVNARNRRGKSQNPRLFKYILCIPELPRRLAKKTAPARGKLKIKLGCISKFESLFSKVENSA